MSQSVSRRSFFRIAVGSLITLPTVAGGFMVPPSVAYAEQIASSESDGGAADGVTARIVVVRASEVGFCVMDMADGGTSKIAGAKVTVTSRYNKKSVEGTSDKDGVVVLDIKDLSENPDGLDVDKLETYEFNGSILVSCDGYRTCELPLVRVEGAKPLLVPTRKLTDGLPYPRSTTLNEWDVLYTANEFTESPANIESHTLAVDWRQMGPGEATVELRLRGESTPLLSTRATPKDGTLTASFGGTFLQEGIADALPTNTEFDIVVSQGGQAYTVPIQLAITPAAADEPEGKNELSLKPMNTTAGSSTAIDAKWPAGIPLVSGGSLKTWSPDLPVNVYINPFGYFQVTLKSPSWGYKKDNSGSGDQGWGKYPRTNVSGQFDKLLESAGKMSTATSSAFSAEGNLNQISFSSSISFMANFQALAAAQWDSDKGVFQGMLGGQVFLACDLSISENFFAGPIPVLITFAINSSLVVSLNCGIYSLRDESNPNEKLLDAAFDFSRWHFDYTNTGLTITLNITPSLSVGVGIRGVASISVMGRFTLTMFSGFTYRGDLDEETHPLPHWIFGYSAQISLVLHMFLFTKTFALKDWKYRDFYDNWKGGLQSMADLAEGDALEALANASLSRVLGQMIIITNDMLYETREFEGSTQLQAQADGEQVETDGPEETFDWETMRQGDITEVLGDGTPITYAVYSLIEDEDEPAMAQQPDSEGASETEPMAHDGVADGATAADGEPNVVETDPTSSSDPDTAPSADLAAIVAESSPADETPADDPATAAQEATRKRVRLSLGTSIDYVPTRDKSGGLFAMADTPGSILPLPKVQQLGIEGGIRPSSDEVIASKVFGDPRVKVINISLVPPATGEDYIRATCSFRIASALVNGEPRTRLVMTYLAVSGEGLDDYPSYYDLVGTDKVIDFDINDVPGVSHKDLFDYDFNLVFCKHSERQFDPMWGEWKTYKYERVHLVIVSGRRPKGDETPLASAATDLVFTYLCFNTRDIEINSIPLHARRSILADEVLGNDGMRHCISSLQCVADAEEDSSVIVVGFLDRMSQTEDGVLTDDPKLVEVKPSLLFVNVRSGSMVVPKRADLDAKLGSIEDASAFELAVSPKIGGYFTLSARGPKRTHFFVLDVNSDNATLSNVWIGGVLDASIHLVAWTAMDCFLTSYPQADYVMTLAQNWENPDELDRTQWLLQTARWNTNTAVPAMAELVFEPIGPKGFNFSNFGINAAGTFIFWPQGKEGDDGRVYAEDGSYEENEDVPVHQIMACRYYNGKFSDPFIAADVTHDMSSMQIVTTYASKSPLEVLSNELFDPADDKVYYASNVWYTSVPNLLSATAVGCECPVPLVSPGGTVRFNVTVRNDGNTFLRGCTLQLCVHENDEVSEVSGSSASIEFNEDTLQGSSWNPPADDGSLQNVEDDWSLAPGKQSVYRVDVAIPANWGGEKFVSFVARDPQMADDGGLNAQAEEGEVEYVDFSIEPGAYKVTKSRTSLEQDKDRTYMQSITVTDTVASGEAYADAPVSVTGTSGTQPSVSSEPPASNAPAAAATGTKASAGTSATTSTSPSTATSSGRLVSTADPTFGALSAGLALAGAAFTAYGKRRARNENDEDEE